MRPSAEPTCSATEARCKVWGIAACLNFNKRVLNPRRATRSGIRWGIWGRWRWLVHRRLVEFLFLLLLLLLLQAPQEEHPLTSHSNLSQRLFPPPQFWGWCRIF